VWAYFNYLEQKGEKLKLINQGICPECKNETMEVINQKGGGCSGTSFVEFRCSSCKYEDSFNLGGGSCRK
jgi:transposase-like protein